MTTNHAVVQTRGMTDDQLARLFSEALVSEIKAEMGRRDLSTRGLARLIDANSQYLSQRLDGGSPRTGVRVPLNAVDLVSIADALGVSLAELIGRAEVVSSRQAAPVSAEDRLDHAGEIDPAALRRDGLTLAALEDKRAADSITAVDEEPEPAPEEED